jgi:hypothetical protein
VGGVFTGSLVVQTTSGIDVVGTRSAAVGTGATGGSRIVAAFSG